jgi:CheY-like chemotaxis protein
MIALSSLDTFTDMSNFQFKLTKPVHGMQLLSAISKVANNELTRKAYIGGEFKQCKSNPNSPYLTGRNHILPVEPVSPQSCNCKILIAEDVETNRDMLFRVLTSFGYTNVHLAENGLVAIAKIEEAELKDKEPFQILLMDLRMPVLDGYGVIDYMNEKLLKLPIIIAVTACVMRSDRKKCKSKGIEFFIHKPIQINQLKDVLVHAFIKVKSGSYPSKLSPTSNRRMLKK